MKRAIVLFVVAISSAANIFSQSHSEENDCYLNAFEADSAVWSYLYAWDTRDTPQLYQTILHGDTVVDNFKWKIVTDGFIGKGLVRTDGKKVIVRGCTGQFSFMIDDKSEKLFVLDTIYDFSLNVGDSALTYYEYHEPGYPYHPSVKDEIIEIDSIILNDGKKHKRMKVAWYTEAYMIEGVGCTEGYLSHPFFMFIRIPTGYLQAGRRAVDKN